MNYFAKIKYNGGAFCGFQVQPSKRTVQGELNSALDLCFGAPCRVTGCSRTDAGVHANEFAVKIESEGATVPPDRLPLALACYLPSDLSLYWARECDAGFHPRYDAVSKEYLYRIYNSRIADPFEHGRSWFLPRIITEEGIDKMNSAAKYIEGRHDFTSFMSSGSSASDTVRNVHYLNVKRASESIIEIRIAADGFLYNMVRIIVGTLAEVALGRFAPDYVKQVIAAKDRSLAGPTAPPEGLYLNKVNY